MAPTSEGTLRSSARPRHGSAAVDGTVRVASLIGLLAAQERSSQDAPASGGLDCGTDERSGEQSGNTRCRWG